MIELLTLANVDLSSALKVFSPSVQQWCPILPGDAHRWDAQLLVAEHPLLALGVWLVTKTARGHPEHFYGCQLYRSLKQSLALLQTSSEVTAEALQLGLLIAVYEVSHGMKRQAFQSLGSCKAMLILLEYDALYRISTRLSEMLEWLKASLLMLDRYVLPYLPPHAYHQFTPPQNSCYRDHFTSSPARPVSRRPNLRLSIHKVPTPHPPTFPHLRPNIRPKSAHPHHCRPRLRPCTVPHPLSALSPAAQGILR